MRQANAVPHEASAGGYALYWRTWGWLLLVTLLEVGVVYVPAPRGYVILAVVFLALVKAALIVSNFMHLRFERRTLGYAVAIPVLFLAALFAFVWPDALRIRL